MYWATTGIETLWRHAWVVLPVALAAVAICRLLPSRPVTRHAMWVVVLAWFIAPLLLPELPTRHIRQIAQSVPRLVQSVPQLWRGESADEQDTLPQHPTAPKVALADAKVNSRTGLTSASGSDGLARRNPNPKRQRGSSGPNPKRQRGSCILSPTRQRGLSKPTPNRDANLSPKRQRGIAAAPAGKASVNFDARTPSRASDQPVPSSARNAPRIAVAEAPATPARRPVRSELGAPTSLPPAPDSSGHSSNQTAETAPAAAATETDHMPAVEQGGDAYFLNATEPAETDDGGWVTGLRGVRDALFRLPTLPAAVWIVGIVIVLSWNAIGLLLFAARLRRAYPAPAWIRREVRQVARRFGLAQIPETLVVDARISPLVLSGLHTRLILPSGLWGDLDRAGRRAILCHELAHMSRRDHWIRWGEILISTLCWWHPLVWWVRRRIHEEADLSCDAWVTWLMPRGRRAYAEALLRTNAYLSQHGGPMPSVGLGVTSAGAKRFARRITMVMTDSKRPRFSSAGLLLACGLGLTGWAVMPALSCPPEKPEKPNTKTYTLVTPSKVEAPAQIVVDAKAPQMIVTAPKVGMHQAPLPAKLAGPLGGSGTFVVAPQGDAPSLFTAAGSGGTSWAPLASGAGFVGFLGGPGDDDDHAERIHKMEQQLAELSRQLAELSREIDHDSGHAPRAPRAPRPPRAPQPPRASGAPGAHGGFFDHDQDNDQEMVWRTYTLSKGKLKALTALMVRDDVPILVSPGDDAIQVQATPANQAIFEAFVNMIDPKGAHDRGSASADADRERAFAAMARERALAAHESAEARVRALREAAKGEFEQQAAEMARQTQEMTRQAEEMARRADELSEQANQIQEQAEHAGDQDQQRKLERQARELERKARQIQRKSETLQRKSDARERKSDGAKSKTDDDAVHALLDQLAQNGDTPAEILDKLDKLPEATPAVAEALRAAANAIRDEARPEVREAIRKAVEEARHSAEPAVRDALANYVHVDEDWLAAILKRVADNVDKHVGPLGDDTLEEVARMLEQQADQIDKQQSR